MIRICVASFFFLLITSVCWSYTDNGVPDNPAPYQPEPAVESDNSTIIPALESLKSFLNTSLWILHVSKNLSDQAMAETAEQVYAVSLDENKRASENIAEQIVQRIKDGSDDYFYEFLNLFSCSSENEKNGFGILALCIEDKLKSEGIRLHSGYQELISAVVTEAAGAHISFAEFETGIAEMIDRYGLIVVKYHGDALYELVKTHDEEEFAKKAAFYRKAFDLYSLLNFTFCTQPTGKASAEEEYRLGRTAMQNGSYEEAIGHFNNVILIDPAYAAQNGCYTMIGSCYKYWGKYEEALDSYKKGIEIDATDPYKRSALDNGVEIYLQYLPRTEESLLNGIAFLDDVLALTDDNLIHIKVKFHRGNVYEYLGVVVSSLSDSQKRDYKLESIKAYKDYVASYINDFYLPDPMYVRGDICDLYYDIGDLYNLATDERLTFYETAISEYKQFEQDYAATQPSRACSALSMAAQINYYLPNKYEFGFSPEQKKAWYEAAIKLYASVRAKYPDQQSACETALGRMANSYYSLGYDIYSGSYWETGVKIYDRTALLESERLYMQFVAEYPEGTDQREMIGQLYERIAESYIEDSDLSNCIKYYKESNTWYYKVVNDADQYELSRLRSQQSIANNFWQMSKAYLSIGNDPVLQKQHGTTAIEEYRKVIDFQTDYNPYIPSSKRNIADIYREIGEYDSAIEWYDKVISEYAGTSNDNLTWMCWIRLGDCYYQKEDYTTAKEKYNTIFTLGLPQLQDSYYYYSYLGLGKCDLKLGNYQAAHENFARVVKDKHQEKWYWDDDVIEGKEGVQEVLRIKIEPMVSELEEGESADFTATIVYPDDTPALVPAGAIIEWTWEVSGNEGDGHTFNATGNTATYVGGTGDFMDTIITAKCHLDAGGYGAKRNKAVEPDIWIEGDNQVPLSLIDDDMRRIDQVAIHMVDDGTDRGLSPYHGQLQTTIQFITDYFIETQDKLLLNVLVPGATNYNVLELEETELDSRVFKSIDGTFELTIAYPEPSSAEQPNTVKRKDNIMKFTLKIEKEAFSLEIPIWWGPEQTLEVVHHMTRRAGDQKPKYIASNQIFKRGTCGKLDMTQYIPVNAKFRIHYHKPDEKNDVVIAKLKSAVDVIDNIECNKTSPGNFLSEPFYAVYEDYPNSEIVINGKSYRVFRVKNVRDKQLLDFKYIIEAYERETKCRKPMLAFFGMGEGVTGYIKAREIFQETCKKELKEVYGCEIIPDLTPTRSELRKLKDYRNFYLATHGFYIAEEGQSKFKLYEDEEDFDPENFDMYGAFEVDAGYVADFIQGKDLKLVIMNCCHIAQGNDMPRKWREAFNAECFIGWDKNTTGYLSDISDPEAVNSAAAMKTIQLFFNAMNRWNLGKSMELSLKVVAEPWYEAFLKGELLKIDPQSAIEWELEDLREK